MSERARARLLLLVAAALWSMSGVFLKSLPEVHWIAIAGVRSIFASLLFLPGLTQARPGAGKLVPAVLIYAFLVSTLMGSMQLGTAAQGIWLQYIAPALVALWAWRVQHQRLRSSETLAVLLTCAALVLIVTGGEGEGHRQSVALGLVSGVSFGVFILLLKSLQEVPPSAIFVWTNLGTAAILLPIALALGIRLPSAPAELGLLAAMGLVQLALPYHFFQRGLAGVRALEASLIILLEPILNPIWVYLAIGEVPSGRVIAGCGLIALGLVVFALQPGRDENAQTASGGTHGA